VESLGRTSNLAAVELLLRVEVKDGLFRFGEVELLSATEGFAEPCECRQLQRFHTDIRTCKRFMV